MPERYRPDHISLIPHAGKDQQERTIAICPAPNHSGCSRCTRAQDARAAVNEPFGILREALHPDGPHNGEFRATKSSIDGAKLDKTFTAFQEARTVYDALISACKDAGGGQEYTNYATQQSAFECGADITTEG